MSYLLILAFVVFLVGFVFHRGMVNEKNKRQKKINAVLSLVGKKPQASLRCSVGKNRVCEIEDEIDDITWENLDMESIYDRMNYCLTMHGAEYLYEILHRPASSHDRLEALEKAIILADENKEELIRLLCSYQNGKAVVDAKETSIRKENPALEAASNMWYLLALMLMYWNAAFGVLALLLVASYMIVTYFSKKSRAGTLLSMVEQIISTYYTAKSLSAFRYLERTNKEFSRYENLQTDDLTESRLLIKQVAKHALWFDGGSGAGSGLDTVLVYLKMLFHIDLIILYKLGTNIDRYMAAAKVPGRFIGFADATLSIALWRCSAYTWSKPVYQEKIYISEAVHPLLDKPVATSISLTEKGVLLTGSNASGKTTFLKNIALQLILAQTVNTVTAKEVRLPLCQVISAMGVKDNLLKGDSYYMAEIKAIRRIFESGFNTSKKPLVCFLDEILRGTNTRERIAGAAAILKNMVEQGFVVFCATHDGELTYILEECFENYHFSEKIINGDISFDYELNTGRANTSNAISLLKFIGFNDKIIVEANKLLLNC